MKARLSGVDRQVLDAIELKVLHGRVGCVIGRVSVQTLAEAIDRTEQAVRLSLKRLAGLGIVQLSFAGRQLTGVQIHQSILAGTYSQPIPKTAEKSTVAADSEKIFSSDVLPSPPKPPTTRSSLNLSINNSTARGGHESGDPPPSAPPVDPRMTAVPIALAALGAGQPRERPTATAQGIQQPPAATIECFGSTWILGRDLHYRPAPARRFSG